MAGATDEAEHILAQGLHPIVGVGGRRAAGVRGLRIDQQAAFPQYPLQVRHITHPATLDE
ncbi:hypothetical protein GCM10010341_89390 [Streptomyces noursei]|nr:hypothetical protein GCM10010341_89390 [Streptomyces noursei]